jgi:hypothetical protein
LVWKHQDASQPLLTTVIANIPFGSQSSFAAITCTATPANQRANIYGNFFYRNAPCIAVERGGNIALYNNVFVSYSGDAAPIQTRHGAPHIIEHVLERH